MAWTWRIFWTTSQHFQGLRKEAVSQVEGASSRQINMAEIHDCCWVGGFLWRVTFLVLSVIGIVAAAVCLLISLLFPVNYTAVTFCAPSSLLWYTQGRGEERRGAACGFSGFTELENKVSKAQHKLLFKCTRWLFQNAWKKNITVHVHRDEGLSCEYNYYLSTCANSP